MYLSDINMQYDENYYYFSLATKELKPYSESEDNFRMWLKKDSTNLDKSSSLKINFIIK